jgi:beta-hydroxyacyl-ACP dehydratase FabZ
MTSYDSSALLALLPHRYPFLMIDEVLTVEAGKRVVAIKNVTMNEWFFRPPYLTRPTMPNMLVLEAMAQTGGILVLSDRRELRDFVAYFTGADNVQFHEAVHPGAQLRIEATILRARRTLYRFGAKASVNGTVTTEAEITVAVGDGRLSD